MAINGPDFGDTNCSVQTSTQTSITDGITEDHVVMYKELSRFQLKTRRYVSQIPDAWYYQQVIS